MSKVSKTSVAARSRRPAATILVTGPSGPLSGPSRPLRLAVLAVLSVLLAGCGQKGPLTLPAPSAAAPANAASAAR